MAAPAQCVCPRPEPPMTSVRVSWCPVHGPEMTRPVPKLRVIEGGARGEGS